ncbi:MAG: LdpA C-terminal domain-containing domain [Candidatus Omnitrophota bacterium]
MFKNSFSKRYTALRDILREKRLFKLVCGAGNEDPREVKRLALVFTLAGAGMLDLSSHAGIVDAAQEGVRAAYSLAPRIGRSLDIQPFLNVSIGIKGDPHVRKARIDLKKCSKCGRCVKACGQNAIRKDFTLLSYRCIGCGHCAGVCAAQAIGFTHKKADFAKILPACTRNGVETMELHAATEDDSAFLADWKLINRLITGNYLSLCIDRSLLSNERLIERVRAAYQVTGDRLIIQADGIPMSGSEKDDYNNTLQAVACADIVQKSGIPVKILLSGGTNRKTGALAKLCGVEAHGVAVGSFARKLVKEFINRDDFEGNIPLIKKAIAAASELVRVNLKALHD